MFVQTCWFSDFVLLSCSTKLISLCFPLQVFDFLFALPDPQNRHFPKCKSQSSRSAAYDLLVELVKGTMENYVTLHSRLLAQHKPGKLMRNLAKFCFVQAHPETYTNLSNLGLNFFLFSRVSWNVKQGKINIIFFFKLAGCPCFTEK